MTIQTIEPAGWKTPKGYSYAMRGNDRLNIAGIMSTDPATGELVAPNDFAGQWSQIWQNLSEILTAAGSSTQSVTNLRIYVTDLNAYNEAVSRLGKPWRSAFGDHFPLLRWSRSVRS
jgi:enamine deaminase RidA (YjgF/YER057c/UK114 family)